MCRPKHWSTRGVYVQAMAVDNTLSGIEYGVLDTLQEEKAERLAGTLLKLWGDALLDKLETTLAEGEGGTLGETLLAVAA